MNHYEAVASETARGKPKRKQKKLDTKLFRRKLKTWCYAFVFSLLPSILVFFLHTGPPKKFEFLAFFSDNALFYVGVTTSAVALYTYRLKDWVRFLHTIILATGMAIYFSLAIGAPVTVFNDEAVQRWTVFVFLLVSVVSGVFALLNSSIKRGK